MSLQEKMRLPKLGSERYLVGRICDGMWFHPIQSDDFDCVPIADGVQIVGETYEILFARCTTRKDGSPIRVIGLERIPADDAPDRTDAPRG